MDTLVSRKGKAEGLAGDSNAMHIKSCQPVNGRLPKTFCILMHGAAIYVLDIIIAHITLNAHSDR